MIERFECKAYIYGTLWYTQFFNAADYIYLLKYD